MNWQGCNVRLCQKRTQNLLLDHLVGSGEHGTLGIDSEPDAAGMNVRLNGNFFRANTVLVYRRSWQEELE